LQIYQFLPFLVIGIGIDKLFDFFKDLNSDSEGNVYKGQLDMDEGTLEQINSHINLPRNLNL
jgi:hypothetical protein